MGAGASSGIKAAVGAASVEDLKKGLEGLSADDRAKFATALANDKAAAPAAEKKAEEAPKEPEKPAAEAPKEAEKPAAEEKKADEAPKADAPKADIPLVTFVLGGPGAGKGTQCDNILKNCSGWAHISAGDCLREERNNPDSKDGAMINDLIKEGKLVPAGITVQLMLKKMKASEGKSKFLIDGFPRNADNVETWEKEVGKSANVKAVLFFDTTEEEMEKRLIERGKTSGRSDDNAEAIKKRFKTYQDESFPIIEQYKKLNLVYTIDSSPAAEDVWKVVQEKVKEIEA